MKDAATAVLVRLRGLWARVARRSIELLLLGLLLLLLGLLWWAPS